MEDMVVIDSGNMSFEEFERLGDEDKMDVLRYGIMGIVDVSMDLRDWGSMGGVEDVLVGMMGNRYGFGYLCELDLVEDGFIVRGVVRVFKNVEGHCLWVEERGFREQG